MWRSEYMRINSRIILPDIIAQYILNNLVDQYGWIYMKILIGMYGIPQAGILAKKHSHNAYATMVITKLNLHQYYGDMYGDPFSLHW